MRRFLFAAVAAAGFLMAGAFAAPANAGVDVSIGIGPVEFDLSHDRCYDYWYRERHPRYCYYHGYDEYWWAHHHRGWRHHRHHRRWYRHHHRRHHHHWRHHHHRHHHHRGHHHHRHRGHHHHHHHDND
ncbi:MAG: hypothetical protein GC190_01205 [Alphaproteobacteria bacterium]|nr:hypothetical protein [Alphaproteobacteria bacterium]